MILIGSKYEEVFTLRLNSYGGILTLVGCARMHVHYVYSDTPYPARVSSHNNLGIWETLKTQPAFHIQVYLKHKHSCAL
jgi:hypothetical protein